jgi:hypothetical protein
MRDGWTSGIGRRLESGELLGVFVEDSGGVLSSEEETRVPVSAGLYLLFLVRRRACPPKRANSSSASRSGWSENNPDTCGFKWLAPPDVCAGRIEEQDSLYDNTAFSFSFRRTLYQT